MSPFNEGGNIGSENQGGETNQLDQEKAKLLEELEILFAEKEKELDMIYQKQAEEIKRKHEERLEKMATLMKIVKPEHRKEALRDLFEEFKEEDEDKEVVALEEEEEEKNKKLLH